MVQRAEFPLFSIRWENIGQLTSKL